jgi:hypothetical protein
MAEEGNRIQARVVRALAHPTRLQMPALLRDGEGVRESGVTPEKLQEYFGCALFVGRK